MSLTPVGQRTKLSHWLPSLIAGLCLVALLHVQNEQASISVFPEALSVHVNRTMWHAEAGGITAADDDEIRMLRAANNRLGGTNEVELALLIHWFANKTSDPEEKQRLLTEARSLVESLKWPALASAYASIAVLLLTDEHLSTEQESDLTDLAKEGPSSWPIFYLMRLAKLEANNLSPSPQSLSKSAMRDATWLSRFEIGIAIAALVYVLAAAVDKQVLRARPKTRAATALPKVWRPELVMLCIFLTSAVLILMYRLLSVATMNYSLHGQVIAGSIGGAALEVCFPLVWAFHSFVRRGRWYWSSIQLRWRDFQSVRLIIQALGIGAFAFTLETVIVLLVNKLGGTIDLVDSLSRSFWAWGEWSLVLNLFWGCLVAPVSEEIMFRGFLYPAFKNTLSPIWAAAASSAVFALVHGYSIWGFVVVWTTGVVLCYAYERTNLLAFAMMIHSWLNLLISPFDWLWMKS